MDSLEINKIVAAVLTAGIVALFSGFVASSVVAPEELDEPVYVAAGSAVEEAMPEETMAEETMAEGAMAEDTMPEATMADEAMPEAAPAAGVVALLAAADTAAGEKLMKKCKACHTYDKGGANKIGPNLWNIVGQPIAGAAGYKYSAALQGLSGGAWTFEDLDAFLTKPKDYAPGTKMSFAGLKKPEDRASLIAYLRSLSDSPVALPE